MACIGLVSNRQTDPKSEIKECLKLWVISCVYSIGLKDSGHNWWLSKTSVLTWCISTYASNKKPVKCSAQYWSSTLRGNNERKKRTLVTRSCVLSYAWFRYLKFQIENYFFLENYVTSEGVVSHNVLYYQRLSIARNQVTFYDNNYFE